MPSNTKSSVQTLVGAYAKSTEGWSAALEGLNKVTASSSKNVEAVLGSWTAALKAGEALGAMAMASGKKSIEEQVAAAAALSRAKSMREVVDLQTGFARKALDAYATEFNTFAGALTGGVEDTLRPLTTRLSQACSEMKGAA